MKISQLKQIIREEIKHSLNEGGPDQNQLAATLVNVPKKGPPKYRDAANLCDSMAALYGGDNNHFFKKAHPDIQRVWNICNLLAGSGEDGLFNLLAKEKDSLTVIFLKAAKAVKSL